MILLLTLLPLLASCRRSGGTVNQNAGEGGQQATAEQTSSVPPFQTKEPERYRALRVETVSDGADSITTETFIARDGERRREAYVSGGAKVSFLQLPEGTFVLLPEQKLYAEIRPGEAIGPSSSALPEFSTDRLLNASRPEAVYEKLGPETVNGRATQKYRVTLRGRTGAAKEVAVESLIWVDEGLGMPIKSEMTSKGGAESSGAGRVTMELREINETVDASLFELPRDYRKVEAGELRGAAGAEKRRD